MKFFILLLFIAFFGFLPRSLKAQDPYFSQFYANRVYLNPAYAGFEPNWTVNINYRNQWFGIPDASVGRFSDSYSTYNVTAEKQVSCMYGREDVNLGIGISAFRDEAGTQPLVTQGGALALSYEFKFIEKPSSRSKLKRLDFRIGTQLGMMQRSLQGNYFIYSGQLDPVAGLNGMDPSTLELNSRLYPNMNAGFMFRGNVQRNRYHQSLFTVGLTFANVNRPDQSLFNSSSVSILPMRTTFHAGGTIKFPSFSGVKLPVHIAPQFRWDRQAGGKLNTQTIGAFVFSKGYYSGLFFQYNFPYDKSLSNGLGGNALTRNTSTLIFNFGVDLKTVFDTGVRWVKRKEGMVLGFTYDLNLSGLNSSNTLGVMEINLRMNFEKERKRGCGEIGKFELYRGGCPVMF